MNEARNKIVQQLSAIYHDPCPGLCGNPPTQFHHYPWRDGKCHTPEAKEQAYHEYNGVLVCPACHQEEGYEFQTRCAVMVIARAGGPREWFKWAAQTELIGSELPQSFTRVVWAWVGAKHLVCPECGGDVLGRVGICTTCLQRVQARQP